ncbi:methyl-accepting chemotaxis protein [Bacillus sp. FJAT-49732]|uniref:Methyl-accepting chemotaxis protein n=1 Tax=Lederbergia citrisecunda TaxID=2833583 RepID=A0A942YNC4_9BACI|nr:methyl-accepting chemotaxis protein [Lederbergia citrisecunda]MBS4202474.1 methyl-accepting chemotaxis protein [Lederbergia citrisecunda]
MKWTINRKLLGGFAVVIFILIIMVGVSYYQISTVDNNYSRLLSDRAQKSIDVKDLQVATKQEIISMRGYLIVGDEQALQDYTHAHEEYLQKYENLLKRFTNPEHQKMMEEINQVKSEYKEFTDHVFELKKQNKTDEYTALVSSQGRDIVKRFDEQVEKLSANQNNLLDIGNKENSQKVNDTKIQILVLGVIAILLGVLTALIMGRLISKPVEAIAYNATKISDGDLTVDEIHVKNKDEIGELAHSFNQMARNLKHLIEQVGLSSTQVAASAEELTASAEQTTEATTQITTSIQEIASGAETQGQGAIESSQAMKEMAVGIQQVAETTSSVSELATETSKEANNGNRSLQRVIHQMNTIHEVVDDSASVVKSLGEHSEEIGKIIEVITSIADQTNLLALNAAIESARAGEHGRGFAVVADEVRKLAEQSKISADQIAELIQKIQKDTSHAVEVMDKGTHEVVEGVNVVREAEEGFKKILQLIEQVTAQIQEASAVSEEMSASAEEINASIEEIAHIAQVSASNTQNVASASEEQMASMEEIASSAGALSKMAEDLQLQVTKFRV